MKLNKAIQGISCGVLLFAAAGDGRANDHAEAIFLNTANQEIGSASLTSTPTGVLISAEVSNLPPGEHAFHIHTVGRCDSTDGFKSAGDHYAPDKHPHGYKVAGGPHAGDMPNQFVSADGKLHTQVFNPQVSLSGEGSLLDSDGAALVLHAKGDDYQSQPAGAAGDRIACAVIKQK